VIALGLSSADLRLFNLSLSTHHSIKITVQLLDLSHRYISDLSDDLIDGQVSIDADAEVTRSLTLQLRDPDHSLHLDSSSPADGALYFDRMIRVIYSVKSELLPRWVDVPIFCGPVSKMSRTADVINVECMGKESLVLPPTLAYFTKTWGKGTNRRDLVAAIMSFYGGETRYSFPRYSDKTTGPTTLTPESNIWATAKAVNGSFATRQLFYDGRGVLVMRSRPRTSTYTFKTGPGGNVTSVPVIDYDISSVRNLVTVKGAIPKGKKTPVAASVALPAAHPLNSVRLGRNGRHRVLYEVISDDNVKTTAQAQSLAKARVNSLALQAVDISFDALVAPHLEPNDIYVLKTPDLAVTAYYKKATIPLKQGIGSVGVLMMRSTNKTRIRRR
jgi:hypothetical protein